ncbi:thiol-disulfide isomerase/thioredoxin [Mucilaginibacter sp. SG538B]|uniref:TlpA family protein disulfide reductase n=1 Tax=Mucilaginibacter sp. SG538B TaxID=2587021 RepID=UPI00159E354F|nr:TlpA disulfide reductase family protein [Mucilaginibacter sp. SG538B]NVM66619.1 thiol-disulfide isomerase/thioredoxin [Mucilaginibacter sp. SG538B]
MKRFFCFLALLCFFFGAGAQENTDIKAGVGSVVPLKIGDRVPPVVLSGLINGAGLSGKGLSVFKSKLLILDFWATWCTPCVEMIPKINAIQETYKGKVQIVPVAYQGTNEVATFLARLEKERGIKDNLPMVVGDTELGKLFPHSELPHLVWIGPDGIVKAITDQRAFSNEVIDRFLAGQDAGVKLKKDEIKVYDPEHNLLINRQEDDPGIAFAVTGYLEGVGRGYYNNTMIPGEGEDRRMTARNQTIPELYLLAYSKWPKEVLIEAADTSALTARNLNSDDFREWLKQGHGYCMELIMPDTARNRAYAILKEKLGGYFTKYHASLEMRKVKCLVLVRTSGADKIRSAGETPAVEQDAFGARFTNCYLRVFIKRMQLPLQYHPLPLKDETGYAGKADLTLKGNLTDLAEVNRELARYDLRFEERPADMEMLVIRDAVAAKP